MTNSVNWQHLTLLEGARSQLKRHHTDMGTQYICLAIENEACLIYSNGLHPYVLELKNLIEGRLKVNDHKNYTFRTWFAERQGGFEYINFEGLQHHRHEWLRDLIAEARGLPRIQTDAIFPERPC
jgi:hypothetical protein